MRKSMRLEALFSRARYHLHLSTSDSASCVRLGDAIGQCANFLGRERIMRIFAFFTLLVVSSAASSFIAPASAANPKYAACLKEAEGKGLVVTHAQGRAAGGRANAGLASQRQAFMKECMARR
jgi:hypothetical protein